MIKTFNHVKISAIGAASGLKQFDVMEVCKVAFGEDKTKRLIKSLGFKKVRAFPLENTVADGCQALSEQLFEKRNLNPKNIDCVVFVTQRPDSVTPATTFLLQPKLGLRKDVLLFDITQGCAGFVYGLELASALIESKTCKNALVLVGDTCCLAHDLSELTQPANVALLGDGSGLAYLEYSEKAAPASFSVLANGELAGTITNKDNSSRLSRNRLKERLKLGMTSDEYHEYLKSKIDDSFGSKISGTDIAVYAIDVVKPEIDKTLMETNLTIDSISKFIVHQANKTILKSLALTLGCSSDKVPFLSSETGNTSSASIPLAICEHPEIHEELRQKQVFFCGFGVGMTCANAVIELSETELLPALYI